MAPSTEPLNLDIEAISGICGSVSIACWVVVFSPQIIENFKRSSADGLSLQFIIVWLLGDVFNILGAVMQGVLPTMLILAIYYTIADIVLLGQCFYYRGFTWKDEVVPPTPKKPQRSQHHNNGHHHTGEPNERTGLLPQHQSFAERERRGSDWSDRLTHLNPVVPLSGETTSTPSTPPPPPSRLQTVLWNTFAVLMVIAAGVAGYFLSRGYSSGSNDDRKHEDHKPQDQDEIHLDLWGQIFGYLCAVLYLGSRLPQLLLNWRRKSTEGVSMLFFLFACLGNLTYVLSIFAFDTRCRGDECEPGEAARLYGQYILVNASWLAGSAGTLLLDMGIFAQFFIYSKNEDYEDDDVIVEEDEERSIDGDRWDQRPILDRHSSDHSN